MNNSIQNGKQCFLVHLNETLGNVNGKDACGRNGFYWPNKILAHLVVFKTI